MEQQNDKVRRTPIITRESISKTYIKPYDQTLIEKNNKANAVALKLERAYNDAKANISAMEIQHKIRYSDYDDIIGDLTKKKTDAEAKALYHYKKAEDAAKTLAMIKTEHASVAQRLRLKLEESESQNARLSSDLISEKREREKAHLMLQNKETEWSSQIQQLETTINILKQQVEEQQKSISESLQREYNLTNKWNDAENRLRELNDIKYDMAAINAFDQQIKLQDDTRKIEIENIKLKNELKHYKEMYHNVEMLREEKYSLESRVQEMEQLKADNLRLDLENTRLKQEKLEWAGYLESNDGLEFETPKGIIYNLSKDREISRMASEEVKLLKNELESKNKMVVKLEDHLNDVRKEILEKDRMHRSDKMKMNILDQDKAILRKHVDMLENQLKLYDIEEKDYMEGSYDAIKSQRLHELQGLLKELEHRLDNAGKELIHSQPQIQSPSDFSVSNGPYIELASGKSIVEFLAELSKERFLWAEDKKSLQSEIKTQQKTINISKEQIQQLNEFIQRHEMDKNNTLQPAISDQQQNALSTVNSDEPMYDIQDDDECKGVRILMLKNNPASVEYGIRKQRLEQLQKENEALLKQLEKYHSTNNNENTNAINKKRRLSGDNDMEHTQQQESDNNDSNDTSFIPIETLINVKQEVDTLKKDNDKKDKRIIRLTEVFEKKISDFMEKVETLLGYKITESEDGIIRLESTFVDGRDLSFQVTSLMNDHGVINVLGRKKDDYMYTLRSTYETFITNRHSILGFLNAATLELLDRQTEIYNPAVTHDYMKHDYIEEDPVVDSHGHELVNPKPIDREDELDEDFIAQADDSGDDDYVEYTETDELGYDDDRLEYFGGQDEEDTEDFDGKKMNQEIMQQERSYEGYYEKMGATNFGAGNENDPISLDDDDEDEEENEDEELELEQEEEEEEEISSNDHHTENNGDEYDIYEIDDDEEQEEGEVHDNDEDENMVDYLDDDEDDNQEL
ncbi:unnamed protein product [Cunninghamella echinulata]